MYKIIIGLRPLHNVAGRIASHAALSALIILLLLYERTAFVIIRIPLTRPVSDNNYKNDLIPVGIFFIFSFFFLSSS